MQVISTVCGFFGFGWNNSQLSKEYNNHYFSLEDKYEKNFYAIKKSLMIKNNLKVDSLEKKNRSDISQKCDISDMASNILSKREKDSRFPLNPQNGDQSELRQMKMSLDFSQRIDKSISFEKKGKKFL